MTSDEEFSYVSNKLRTFFLSRNFIECHPQSELCILAACEDPSTITIFNYAGKTLPLPQTGQMHLEHKLCRNPGAPGYFCVTTSYRNEPNPVPGRHDLVFPMFEFELKGSLEDLIQLETDLLIHLGYKPCSSGKFPQGTYDNVAREYGVHTLDHIHEKYLERDYGDVYFLTDFPEHTSPFWNMSRDANTGRARKVDVILSGIETFGSAERSSDKTQMRETFYTISDGEYAQILFDSFGCERVEEELNGFLNLNFIQRCGGGIGMTRLIKSMHSLGLIF